MANSPPSDAAPPPAREEIDAVLREQDWGSIFARLVAFASMRADRARAEDLAQAAIAKVFDITRADARNPCGFASALPFDAPAQTDVRSYRAAGPSASVRSPMIQSAMPRS